MATGLYSGVSGLAIGVGLNKGVTGLWSGASGLITGWGATAFNPLSLFAASEPGAWYDPSDLSTMFQDTAGTTPVTATGQTVGLLLDKSKGLVLGPELVTNGWTTDAGWSQSGQTFTATNAAVNAGVRVAGLGVAGRWYRITITWSGANGAWRFYGDRFATLGDFSTASGTINAYWLSTGGTTEVRGLTGSQSGTFNISVKELPGNHATQATAASRPIYGIEPFGGRRNLFTWTQDLTNLTNWPTGNILNATRIGAGVSVTTDEGFAYIAPSGRPPVVSGVTYTFSATIVCDQNINNVPIRFGGGLGVNAFALVNMSAGVPQRVSLTATATGSGLAEAQFGIDARNAIVPGGSNATGYVVTFSDPQFEVGSTATAYQRVTDQWNVTQAGVPSVSYIQFDGTDDFLLTGTITPGIDKAQVFAGVRKLSGAASAVVAELSTAYSSNAGTFALWAPFGAAANYSWVSRGSVLPANATSLGYASPTTNVITGLSDISADQMILRADGTQVASNSGDQGTGNFLAYPLYIGRRAGSSFPLNGRIYQMVVRFGANLSAATITQTENYTAGKTGIYTVEQLIRLNTLNASGTSFLAYAAADSSGNNYPVTNTVLAADGTPYSVL